MSYEAYLTATFQKSIKILKKKFRSVKDDLYSVIQTLEKDPTIGDPIPGWNKEL
jgi:mRNA-degrading endonuclease YafQ of YafQ-DinJ toxin-antitoxin module